MSEYWEKRWSKISQDIDEQSQVGRAIRKQPISDELFERTVEWVSGKMRLDRNSDVLELCCGNGVWTIPFARQVKSITAVDFSKPLLEILSKKCDTQNIKNANIVYSDVCAIDNFAGSYSHIFWYFAIQHFSEKEVICIFEKTHGILKNNGGGVVYIGDIPDREKLWDFASTEEYVKMYFDSVKNGTPAIGTWFVKNDLVKLAEYAGFSKIEIVEQPSWQFNSNYRFDLKLEV